MGHRALVAYKRPDGQYNLHYSHWGALNLQLKHEIREHYPFGGEKKHDGVCEYFSTLRMASVDLDLSDFVETVPATSVDVEPLAHGVELERIFREYLDYLHHEAFYVVDLDFEVTAYRTLWFGLQYEAAQIESCPTVGNGAIRTVRWYNGDSVGDGYARGRFQGLKDTVGDMIDRGVFDHEQALQYLERTVVANAGEEEILIRTPR